MKGLEVFGKDINNNGKKCWIKEAHGHKFVYKEK